MQTLVKPKRYFPCKYGTFLKSALTVFVMIMTNQFSLQGIPRKFRKAAAGSGSF